MLKHFGSCVFVEVEQLCLLAKLWLLRYSERHWNCTAHFRYRGSIEYHNTWDGIIIVAPISGITQHYHKRL